MSEAVPQSNEGNVEQLSNWRERKEQAPKQVAEMIAAIPGYEAMNTSDKVTALQELINSLGDPADPVANREGFYIEKELGRQIAILEENERHQQEMVRLVG